MNQALQNVLSVLEPHALTFCTTSEWDDVKADVLVAGSVSKATKTSQQVLQKAVALRQFGSRSDAGRYAAMIRWNTAPQNRQEGTGFNWKSPMPKKPKAPSTPIGREFEIDRGTVGNISAGKKALQKITEMSASRKPGFGISRADKKLMTMGAKQVVRAKNFGEAIDAMHQMRTEGGELRGLLRVRGAAKVALARFNFEHPETADVQTWPTVATVKAVDGVDAIVDEVEKARARAFASRSEAGRYAASIRWQNARGQAAAGGTPPPDDDGPMPAFGPPGTNQAWEDRMTREYMRQGFSESDARERAVFERKVGETPQSQAAMRMRQEQEQLQQARESMAQRAVDAERERREASQAEQEAENLGISDGANATYRAVSDQPPTPAETKALAGKVQVGSGQNMVSSTDDAGEKYMSNQGNYMGMRVRDAAVLPNPKGYKSADKRYNDGEAYLRNLGPNLARVFNSQQEKVAALSPSEFKAKTVTPVGLVEQAVPRSSRPDAKVDTTTLAVLDQGGTTMFANARHIATAQRAFPNATMVAPDGSRTAISFVDPNGTVQAMVMPFRITGPDTAVFQARATAQLQAQTPAE